MCWEQCKEGYHDDGATCRKDAHIFGKDSYGRGAGKAQKIDKHLKLHCDDDHPDKEAGLCYVNCRDGYKGVGPVCWRYCPDDYHDDGATCRKDVHIYGKKSEGRGVGKPMTCSSDKEYDAGLCYDKCKANYNGVGPVCWEECNKDFSTNCLTHCGVSKTFCNPAAIAATVVSVPPCTESPSAKPCNGSVNNCGKKYNEVAFPATHNAYAIVGGGITRVPIGFENQTHSMRDQLHDGIRGLMIDVYQEHGDNGPVVMCHQECKVLNFGRFTDALRTIRRFLDVNPSETVTIILENYVKDVGLIWNDIKEMKMEGYIYYKNVNEEWPTLDKLSKKIIIFTDSYANTDKYPGIMPYKANAFENPYSFKTAEDIDKDTCPADRGTETIDGVKGKFPAVFVMNHFATPLGPVPVGWGLLVNKKERIQNHVNTCTKNRGRIPNFVAVDHYSEGGLFDVISKTNDAIIGKPVTCPPHTSPNHTPTDVGANASLAQPKGKSILNTNEKLVSKNGRFTLSMQSDCNLVLYDAKKGKGGSDPSAASWSSNTSVGGGASCKATFREDGSLAVINKDGKVVYQSGAASISAALQPAILILQEDGNLVAYQCDEPYWASNTSTP